MHALCKVVRSGRELPVFPTVSTVTSGRVLVTIAKPSQPLRCAEGENKDEKFAQLRRAELALVDINDSSRQPSCTGRIAHKLSIVLYSWAILVIAVNYSLCVIGDGQFENKIWNNFWDSLQLSINIRLIQIVDIFSSKILCKMRDIWALYSSS